MDGPQSTIPPQPEQQPETQPQEVVAPQPEKKKSNKRLIIGLAVMTIIILSFIGVLAYNNYQSRPKSKPKQKSTPQPTHFPRDNSHACTGEIILLNTRALGPLFVKCTFFFVAILPQEIFLS